MQVGFPLLFKIIIKKCCLNTDGIILYFLFVTLPYQAFLESFHVSTRRLTSLLGKPAKYSTV